MWMTADVSVVCDPMGAYVCEDGSLPADVCPICSDTSTACADVVAICVESDMAITQGAEFESLTAGCQCCLTSVQDDPTVDPFVLCLGPLLPQVDFCADPGSTTSNPDAAMYECRHACENSDAPWEELEAAGCFNDQHEDQLCVTDSVYAPGEMQPWGDTCCDWCGDQDGDGNPDYQGCCENMRADGQMGCEDTRCEWLCEGVSCFEHGEDQTTCESNSGVWEVDRTCADEIATQGMMAQSFAEDGFPADFAATVWLGRMAETCCVGYEPPNYEGSCNNDVDIYVSVACSCLVFCCADGSACQDLSG